MPAQYTEKKEYFAARMTVKQMKRARKLARKKKITIAEILRQSLDAYLDAENIAA